MSDREIDVEGFGVDSGDNRSDTWPIAEVTDDDVPSSTSIGDEEETGAYVIISVCVCNA